MIKNKKTNHVFYLHNDILVNAENNIKKEQSNIKNKKNTMKEENK